MSVRIGLWLRHRVWRSGAETAMFGEYGGVIDEEIEALGEEEVYLAKIPTPQQPTRSERDDHHVSHYPYR